MCRVISLEPSTCISSILQSKAQKSRIGGDTLGLVDRFVGTDKNHATSPKKETGG
jgi:hypothetical protein